MFFENDDFAASVIDVLNYTQEKKAIVPTSARSFCAMSYRMRSDTYFETKHGIVEANSHSVTLFPSDMEYVRIAENENMIVIHFIPSVSLGDRIKVFYPENYLWYEKFFDKILKVWQRKETAHKLKCNEYFMRLAHMICCEQDNSKKQTVSFKAADIIEKNLSDTKFGVGDIAQRLGVSGAFLRKKFNEEYGTSPCAYLLEKRMENAVSLIETGYFSVKEVALRCGFENEKYFSSVFKKYYGVSPSKF